MNHEEAWGLLSDYVDHDLPEEKVAGLREHLRECSTCRQEVEALRALIGRAAALPREVRPVHDLWPGIFEKLRGEVRSPEEVAGVGLSSRPIEAGPRAGLIPRLVEALSLRQGLWPAAVAAAVALLVLVVGSLEIGRRESSGPVPGGVVGEGWLDLAAEATLEALEAECATGELELGEVAPEEEASRIPGLTVITANLRIVESTIAELREVWKANPESPRAARMLAAAYRTKAVLQGMAKRTAAES